MARSARAESFHRVGTFANYRNLPAGEIDRRDGDVDSMRLTGIERGEVMSFAASGIENRTGCDNRGDRGDDRLRVPAIEEPAARSDSFLRVAGIFRSPVLGLQKVHVAASRNVERMPPRAEDAPYVAHEWLAAVPDRAEKCD